MGPTQTNLPLIGQGTWQMQYDRKGSIRALRRGLDLGMTHIDTAEMYGSARVVQAHGATPYQIALAFLVRDAGLFAIPKSSAEKHVADNAQAAQIVLSPEQVQELEQAFPQGARSGYLPMI